MIARSQYYSHLFVIYIASFSIQTINGFLQGTEYKTDIIFLNYINLEYIINTSVKIFLLENIRASNEPVKILAYFYRLLIYKLMTAVMVDRIIIQN